MIPHTLQLKNFLSYGPEEQTISFAPHQLICLSGKNGHGKSALLDAITWAIWGQARKTIGTSKADDGLMHLGQKYMFVRLDFEVNNQMYRVRREYIKTKSKPLALLDFGILKQADNISSLTDKTIKLTQAKIEKTIGLSYDSFVNSAFLKQGESNSFSKKTPRERKEVLATILNLDKFEALKKSALERAKTIQQQHQSHLYILEKIDEEILSLHGLAEQAQNMLAELTAVLEQEQTLTQQMQEQQASVIALEKKRQEEVFLREELAHIQRQAAEANNQIEVLRNILLAGTSQDKIALLETLEREKIKYASLIEQIHAQSKEEIAHKEAYFALKEKIQATLHQKQMFTEQIKQAVSVLEKSESEAGITAQELATITEQLNIINREKNSCAQQAEQAKKIESDYNEETKKYTFLYAQGAGIKQQLLELQVQIEYFQAANSSCLLCCQSLSADQQNQILTTLQSHQQAAADKLESTRQEIAQLQHRLKELKSQQSVAHAEQNKHEQILFKITEYNRQQLLVQKRAHAIQLAIDAEQEKIKVLTENRNQSQCEKDHLDLTALETSIISIQKQRKEYAVYQEKLQSIETEIKHYHQAQEQHREQAQLIKEIDLLQKQLLLLQEQNGRQLEKISAYNGLAEEAAALAVQKQHQASAYQVLQQKKTVLLTQKGSVETQQERQKILIKNKVHYEEIVKKLHREINDYQSIAKALGKDGIQALLIEEALPEIEQEANLLLARLTNNQTQIFIESLRDLKGGGDKETLDIKIADNMGIRPYEMFSGGEAFRIDFALRIAIAKLVARHAGTALQTIFIDEGFGSQDEEGLQLIMDSIYKIQNDFAMVIIVSHLPRLKEQFPVQFLIQKKPTGTRVTVVEQG
jgi:exonuclease SbcC